MKIEKIEFELKEDYIHLIQLLKYLQLVESGGMAKNVVDEGLVIRNGEVETRKRAKLIPGDEIIFEHYHIVIVKVK